jgi:2-dehydropantoate 2-reductase
VALVARGANLDALRNQGLALRTPEATRTLPIPCFAEPSSIELFPDDVLILSVKTQDTVGVLAEWADHPISGGGTAGERLPILCAQNGVENERLALRRFRHVYGVYVWLPALYLEPGKVAAFAAPKSGLLMMGRYPSGIDAMTEQVCTHLRASRLEANATADIMRWKWAKLLGNLGNAVQALCRSTPDAEALVDRAVAEGQSVLLAGGIDFTSEAEQLAARGDIHSGEIPGMERGGGSSWQSLRRQTGTIESDYLNGEIALLGRELGVATPVNETFQRWANLAAKNQQVPGSMSVSELKVAIDHAAGAPHVDNY